MAFFGQLFLARFFKDNPELKRKEFHLLESWQRDKVCGHSTINLIGKQVATIGRFACGVMRTVIPSPSDLIWDESATSLSNGG